ncbi:SDR family NAD(P)-dependent oxidoreductase [Jannaschia sp. CCS1]|uniref:SDR family NAD(P)-dependent oxidoreductase n=1 Tax=Jannaschia sp. (strain CCS1) TaxID=290400 RepID=UPI000053C94A|nr:SDR family NAD(P)-dependent oxidoreductase [Jannaschia sp. CCS1]ABD54442.1 Twin-arginine translocation pathway signal [Jannaschia sp. CCS1]
MTVQKTSIETPQNNDLNRRAVLAGVGTLGIAASATGAVHAQTETEGNVMENGMLAGKVALVTGAARGIGLSVAKTYGRHGAKVVMLDIADPSAVPPVEGFRIANAEEFQAAIEEVRAIAPDTLGITADVRDRAALANAVAQATETFGGLDIAVANAGYVRWHGFADGTEEDWKSVYDVNVHGVFNTFYAAIPALRQRGGGSLISLSSIAGRIGVIGNGAYNSSKWAVIGMTKQAALELGADHIRANAIAPGPVNTPMYRSEGQKRSMGIDVAALSEVEANAAQDAMLNPALPLGETPASEPQAIANTALYLASDLSADVSGAVLDTALGYNANYTG